MNKIVLDPVMKRFDQTDPIIQREIVSELISRLTKAELFKLFVHDRLDRMGVPQDPDPVKTEESGCRIGQRLSWIETRINDLGI